MTPDLLDRIGRALYGPLYRSELAAALGCSHRTVRRWAEGSHPMPPARAEQLAALVLQRVATLADLAAELAAEKNRTGPQKTD